MIKRFVLRRFLSVFFLFAFILPLISGKLHVPTSQVSAHPKKPSTQITKVEPPNWWVGTHTNDLQLLFTGTDLTGAVVRTNTKGIKINQTKVSTDGRYLFCEISLLPEASAGTVEFEISAKGDTIKHNWPLLTPLNRSGNFQGLTTSDVIYLIMTDRFADGDATNNEPFPNGKTYDPKDLHQYHGGDLRGVMQHLDYLKQLGVTAVWLTPVFNNNDQTGADYHGYGMMDFYGVEEHFGNLADYQKLAQELHKRGMKLIQDVVPNHTGPEHDWVKAPPTPTWYNGTPAKHLDCNFDIPALVNPKTPKAKRRPVTEGWFAGILPDLNAKDPDYARYIIQNTLWWIQQSGQDALRIDTYPYVERTFWPNFQKAIDTEFPTLTDFGEIWNGDAKVISFFHGGKKQWDGIDTGLKTQFDFPLYYAIRDFSCDDTKDAKRITDTLALDHLYGDATTLVTFVGNHDEPRIMTHAKNDSRRVRLAYALLLTLRGIPQLYYGDELGMEGDKDPDNRRDFPGGFGGSNNGFTSAGRTIGQTVVWNDVHWLLNLRREHPALQNGQHITLVATEKQLAFLRSNAKEKLLVVCNGKSQNIQVKIPSGPSLPAGSKLTRFDNPAGSLEVTTTGVEVPLGPFGYQIFLVK